VEDVTAIAYQSEESLSAPIAPVWHTALVLIVLLMISAASKIFPGFAAGFRARGHVLSYAVMIGIEWATLVLVWCGIRTRMTMTELIAGAWPRFSSMLRDIGIAIAYLIIANLVLIVAAHLLQAKATDAMKRLLPHGRTEIALWLLLSLSAGICEEIVFRGYLLRQFTAFSRNPTLGIVAQALLFGAAHGYQGWKYMLVIAVYGCLFGWLASWRRSLRPGMIAHFLQDSAAVFAVRNVA
jgi:CAAX protease family protein